MLCCAPKSSKNMCINGVPPSREEEAGVAAHRFSYAFIRSVEQKLGLAEVALWELAARAGQPH
jgi:hypothetical protein